ncbi:MAG: alanine--glyoxylate aminotransferase family protein [Nitrospiraceae bacterium]|nr:alanine--glyoxylate aminotransferase family protein [Nitrospiraceae bacterium]
MLKRYLLAPGPTPVPPEVLLRMAMPIIHHRAPDFVPVFESVKNRLKWLYQTHNDTLILTSSGTGAMTASVNNFFNTGDHVVVVNGGKFGERWTKICQAYGLSVTEITVPWGHAINPADVAAALEKDPAVKAVFMQAVETSTGVYHDVEGVGSVIKNKKDVLFIVDAISALVAHDLKADAWGVDLMVGGSQKGLMLPPGLAFLSVSEKAWEKAEGSKMPHFYFNLKKEREGLKKNSTNFTPAVSLIVGLDAALEMLEKEGLQAVFARHARLAHATRQAVSAMGLEIYPSQSPSNSVTAIKAPEGVDGQEIYKTLREKYGITAAGGQDKLKGKVFRIAHLGYAGTFDVITAIAAIEMTLKGLGHPVKLGSGVGAAEEILIEKRTSS